MIIANPIEIEQDAHRTWTDSLAEQAQAIAAIKRQLDDMQQKIS
jgi:hypothetical protein